MPSFRVEPAATVARVHFPLDRLDAAAPNGGTAHISWDVRIERGVSVKLASGGTLDKLPGRLFVRIGDASPQGRAKFSDEGGEQWGHISYLEGEHQPSNEPCYQVDLHVSRPLFDRILRLAELRHLPSVDLHFELVRGDRAIKWGVWEREVMWENSGNGRLVWVEEFSEFLAEIGDAAPKESAPIEPMEEHEPPPIAPTQQDIEAVTASVTRVEASIGRLAKTITIALWVIVGILVLSRVFR